MRRGDQEDPALIAEKSARGCLPWCVRTIYVLAAVSRNALSFRDRDG